MFNPAAYENSRADGISVLEIIDANGDGEEPRRFVPLQRTELRGEVVGPLAALRLTQVYRFSRQQCDKVIEAVYRFPLPGDAAVTVVLVRFGDVEIRAELKERQRAESEYEEAKKQGRQAALLTRESPDVFTLQVAGIGPNEDVSVETSYVQLARAAGGGNPGWSLRIPLTTSPRFVREDEATSRHAGGQPLLLLRDPGHRFKLDLALTAAGEATSSTHSLTQTLEDGRLRVQLADGEVVPDRDCVLCWRPVQEAERPNLQVTLHDDAASGLVYFLGLLAPPARKSGPAIPREVILLVDHSGSMEGPKWEAADWAVKQFLRGLTERDTFALGVFHNETRWFAKAPRSADAATVQEAIEFLDKHKDSGGTALGVALEQALVQRRGNGEAARHVLIITDAEVTDAGRILRLVDQETKEKQRRRIDVLCIDAAPNSFLASELAEHGGGVAKFLTSAPEEEDITTALDEVLADWTQPVATGLRLEVNRAEAEAAGHAVIKGAKGSAIDLGDLPAGRSLWVAGRVPRDGAADLSFRVMTSADREVGGCRMQLSAKHQNSPALKALFGARRVLGLELLIAAGYPDFEEELARFGYDAKEVLGDQPPGKSKVYAENAMEDAAQRLRGLLVSEALKYGLASSETAFIAVRSEAGKPVEKRVMVANALPSGWSEEFMDGGARGGFVSMCYDASAMCDMELALDEDDEDATSVRSISPRGHARPRGLRMGRMPSPVALSQVTAVAKTDNSQTIFTGVPVFNKGEALLFDSIRAEDTALLPDSGKLLRLDLEFLDGSLEPGKLDMGLAVLLFVDDLAAPRAQVRLSDWVRQGGTRPLNILRRSGKRVRMVLTDPAGVWASGSPRIRISVQWE